MRFHNAYIQLFLVYYLPSNNKTIGFRCELDGLNILEENNIEYKSLNEYMHACGHDLHMAIMILMINYYSTHDHQPSLLFVFQPSEESGAGALHILKKDITKLKVKEVELYERSNYCLRWWWKQPKNVSC